MNQAAPDIERQISKGSAPAITPGLDDGKRSPVMFLSIFGAWIVAVLWFHPQLLRILDLVQDPVARASVWYFIIFVEIAWLYGFYNIGVVIFADLYHQRRRRLQRDMDMFDFVTPGAGRHAPPVAVLYTTYNDFVEESALSCIELDYPNYHVYLLDDSTDPEYQDIVDEFADRFPDRVSIIRRADREGFKAGNLNNALQKVVTEPFFAIVDADEILPRDFLVKTVRSLLADPKRGFVQANHECLPHADTQLARDLGIGIDIHWRWYQPLRNRYGFVMFLGHGAVLRRDAWEEVGGFPHIVSEDLGYAIQLREAGYYGVFADNVTCFEAFPDSVRAFRVRHVKWTRGTCEFLHKFATRLLFSKKIDTVEKLDILFPTLNLPLTFFFFIFMINAQIMMPTLFGERSEVTYVLFGNEYSLNVTTMNEDLTQLFGIDFFLITIATIFSPLLCFIVDLRHRPARLLRFLMQSTALYAALSPLSFLSVLGYTITRKARFLVTGDKQGAAAERSSGGSRFWSTTHPDLAGIQLFELGIGILFLATAIYSVQLSFLGLALAFIMMPIMHHLGWRFGVRHIAMLAFVFIALGVGLGAAGLAGLHPVFFGFGFHF